MTKEELKNKYSAFITEISEILGLGKPIDVLKLCATTDLFFQPLEKHIEELEKENTELKEELERNCTPEEICMKLEERIHTLEVYLEGAINFLILNGDVDNPIIQSVENILHITFNKNR